MNPNTRPKHTPKREFNNHGCFSLTQMASGKLSVGCTHWLLTSFYAGIATLTVSVSLTGWLDKTRKRVHLLTLKATPPYALLALASQDKKSKMERSVYEPRSEMNSMREKVNSQWVLSRA